MSSTIVRNSLYPGRRALHEEIGVQAELRVGDGFTNTYPKNRVHHGLSGYSGTDGEPDLMIRGEDARIIFIEVKSLLPFLRGFRGKGKKRIGYNKTNTAKMHRDSWQSLKKTAKDRRAEIFMIFEFRLDDEHFIYYIARETQIDYQVNNKPETTQWIHFTTAEIMTRYRCIDFNVDPLEPPKLKKKKGQQSLGF